MLRGAKRAQQLRRVPPHLAIWSPELVEGRTKSLVTVRTSPPLTETVHLLDIFFLTSNISQKVLRSSTYSLLSLQEQYRLSPVCFVASQTARQPLAKLHVFASFLTGTVQVVASLLRCLANCQATSCEAPRIRFSPKHKESPRMWVFDCLGSSVPPYTTCGLERQT